MQWSKWSDDTAGTLCTLRAAFLRSMAIICDDSIGSVNALIPVFRPNDASDQWLWQDATINLDDMTAIAIQIKLGVHRGHRSELQFDGKEVNMFANIGEGVEQQPYITLCMELCGGVHDVLKKTTATQSWGNFCSIPATFSD